MPPDQPPFSDYRSLVTLAARPPSPGAPARRSLLVSTRAKPDPGERLNWAIFASGGVLITLSLVGALWAANHYRTENGTFQLAQSPGEVLAPRVVVTAAAIPPAAAFNPSGGEWTNPRAGRVASAPLRWDELTLMLRTGFSDSEVIAAAAGKQLTTAVGPEQERMLREMGAGNRLIGYLQRQVVYDAPASAPTRAMTANARLASSQTSHAPAATPYPTVDYAARDRQVASLKQRIDALDEQIRVARTRPNGYAYNGWYPYRADNTSLQQSADGYIKWLEDQRDDLRRQKWQLEGR